MSLALHY